MRARPGSSIVLLTCTLALTPPGASAQRVVSFAPTYQGSVVELRSSSVGPIADQAAFHAWGFMVGLERPNRFWQPHVWLQRYEIGQPCATPTDLGDCMVRGWSLSVGPGFDILRTPGFSGTFLTQVGLDRGQGLTGGAGLHLGVRLGVIRPSAFARYQVIRGAHYGTVGVGLVVRVRLPEDEAARRPS